MSGAGTPSANGLYVRQTTDDGREYYNLSGHPDDPDFYSIVFNSDNGEWEITGADGINNPLYITDPFGIEPVPLMGDGWNPYIGDAPIPTLVGNSPTYVSATSVTQGELDAGVTVSGAGTSEVNTVATAGVDSGVVYNTPSVLGFISQGLTPAKWLIDNGDGDILYQESSASGAAFPWDLTYITNLGSAPTPTVSRNDIASEANWQVYTDTTPPSVSITSPGPSSLTGTISITATSTDNIAVGSIAFYLDSTLISTDTTSPYTASLDTTSHTNTSHTLTAVSTDTSGNVSTSSPIAITISNTLPSSGGGGGASYVPMYSVGTTPITTSTTTVTATSTPIITDLGCQPTFLFSITTGKPCTLSTGVTTTPSASSIHYIFLTNLSYHQTGSEVLKLQQYLQSQGLFTVTPNSIFGPITLASVIKFQKLHSITPSVGYWGPVTRGWVNTH